MRRNCRAFVYVYSQSACCPIIFSVDSNRSLCLGPVRHMVWRVASFVLLCLLPPHFDRGMFQVPSLAGSWLP